MRNWPISKLYNFYRNAGYPSGKSLENFWSWCWQLPKDEENDSEPDA